MTTLEHAAELGLDPSDYEDDEALLEAILIKETELQDVQ
jgi:hypothetical protein